MLHSMLIISVSLNNIVIILIIVIVTLMIYYDMNFCYCPSLLKTKITIPNDNSQNCSYSIFLLTVAIFLKCLTLYAVLNYHSPKTKMVTSEVVIPASLVTTHLN